MSVVMILNKFIIYIIYGYGQLLYIYFKLIFQEKLTKANTFYLIMHPFNKKKKKKKITRSTNQLLQKC